MCILCTIERMGSALNEPAGPAKIVLVSSNGSLDSFPDLLLVSTAGRTGLRHRFQQCWMKILGAVAFISVILQGVLGSPNLDPHALIVDPGGAGASQVLELGIS